VLPSSVHHGAHRSDPSAIAMLLTAAGCRDRTPFPARSREPGSAVDSSDPWGTEVPALRGDRGALLSGISRAGLPPHDACGGASSPFIRKGPAASTGVWAIVTPWG